MQLPRMLEGLAGRSAQHRDMLCRMAALSLAGLATGSLQSEANQQLAKRCAAAAGDPAKQGNQFRVKK